MIVIDTPQRYPRYGLCSHLMSTLPGEEGSAELEAFRKRLGLKRQWLQKAGTIYEHYDAMRGRIDAAIGLGATPIDRRQMGRVMMAKKRGEVWEPGWEPTDEVQP